MPDLSRQPALYVLNARDGLGQDEAESCHNYLRASSDGDVRDVHFP